MICAPCARAGDLKNWKPAEAMILHGMCKGCTCQHRVKAEVRVNGKASSTR